MKPGKMTGDALEKLLVSMANGGAVLSVEMIRAHISALTAERDEANVAWAREAADAVALREHTQALEKEASDVRASRAGWRAKAEHSERHLAAIRQRAEDVDVLAKVGEVCAVMGSPHSKWDDDIHADIAQRGVVFLVRDVALGVARHLLGEDATEPVPDTKALHCCGTRTGIHTTACPTVAVLAPLGVAPPSEIDGLEGEMMERPTPRHDGPCEHGVPCSEPTTAEAFATVRTLVTGVPRGQEVSSVEGERILSLLERRMGAMAWAMREVLMYPDHRTTAGGVARKHLRSALTDAPIVFTLEEVEKVLAAYVSPSSLDEARSYLSSMRRTP
jgi:hypothetical protein